MESTITVRLDTQLKADAEATLAKLGLPLSAAVRVFLTQVVLQQRLPFPVQVEQVPIEAPPELASEIVLELIASVTAELEDLAEVAKTAERRSDLLGVRRALLDKRLSFDPHDAGQVQALLKEVSAYAEALSRPTAAS
jgi:DNA-damage-inducible protein J